MNFLLHRHLAAADLGSEIAGIGAMLPDLWRMADRRVRPARNSIELPQDEPDALREVLRGVEHHVAVDRWFHAHPVFTEGERLTRMRLLRPGLTAPHLGLFAHVVWEMCLDGALLRSEGVFATLSALRRGFDASDGAASERAAELHHFSRLARADAERDTFARRLAHIREELARGPWIEGYQHGPGITDRLAGIRARLGLPPMRAEDPESLAASLGELEPAADAALARLLRDRPVTSTTSGTRE